MKALYLTGLTAALLTLAAAAQAQQLQDHAASSVLAGHPAELGGPPQLAPAPPAEAADPLAQPAALALLAQLPESAAEPLAERLATELTRVLASGAPPAFQADILSWATAVPVLGPGALVALALPAGGPGVPAGGATPGQRLRLLVAGGEQLVAVASPAAAGSHTLVVAAAAGLAGRPVVVVVGLEAAPAPGCAALAALNLSATRQLVQQLADAQQQLLVLRRQLAASQQTNRQLLHDQPEQQDLKRQLQQLRIQMAAGFSASHAGSIWPID